MAPKRKEPSTEPARRSSRVVAVAEPVVVVAKVVKPKPTPKAKEVKSKAAAPVKEDKADDEEDEAEDEEEDEEPKAKKPRAATVKKVASGGVGTIVKDIVLKDENGADVSLAEIYEKSGLVIFTYPRANTPGCTSQACAYRDNYDLIVAAGFQVYGLSTDAPKSQLNWKTKKEFQYSLLSDPKMELMSALGVTAAKKRCHFVIEKGGKLLEAALAVSAGTDSKNALAFIKAL